MAKEHNTFIFPNTFQVTSLIQSPKKYNVIDLIKVIGNKILGYKVANIIVQYNDLLLDKFSTTDCQLQALLDKSIIPHTYNLIIRSKSTINLETIICHEMIHFDQYERGDLKIQKDNNTLSFIYKGKEYNTAVDYFSRPWEIEASNLQSKIWQQFKKLYYK